MLVVVLLYPRSLKWIRMDYFYTTYNLVLFRGEDCIPGSAATRQTTVW